MFQVSKLQVGLISKKHSQVQKILNNVQSEILTALLGSVNSDQEFCPSHNVLNSMGIITVRSVLFKFTSQKCIYS